MLNKLIKRLRKEMKWYPPRVTFHEIQYDLVSHSSILQNIWNDPDSGFEPEMFMLFDMFDYDNFIDCGANIGVFSFYISKLKKWNVIAIEPLHENVSYMKRVQEKNCVQFKIIDRAISSSAESVDFFIPMGPRSSRLSSSASLINQFRGTDGPFKHLEYEQRVISTISFKDILQIIGTRETALVKLDIEGSELDALNSAGNYIKDINNVDFIIEIMINDVEKDNIFNFMTSLGYDGYLITNAGLVKENRPLTLPFYDRNTLPLRTCWKSHFFTKKKSELISRRSKEIFGYYI